MAWYGSGMTSLLPDEREFDAMIFTTDHGPMIVSRQHPKPQRLTDPALLAILYADKPAS